MKYKIKKIVQVNGYVKYKVYVKSFFGWTALDHQGDERPHDIYHIKLREEALSIIDIHHGKRIQNITIEYVIK